MEQLQLVMRCDYGVEAGWGHIVRSSALAALARKHGIHTILITRSTHSGLPEDIQSAFNETIYIPDEDAFFTWLISHQTPTTAIVTDSHEYTTQPILHVRRHCLLASQPLYIITDFPPEKDIDFSGVTFVFGGIFAEMTRNTLPPHKILPGLNFTLIRHFFQDVIAQHNTSQSTITSSSLNPPSSPTPCKKCVIMMGGTDPFQATPKALEYLYKALGKNVWPTVIHRKQDSATIHAIEKQLSNFPNFTWLEKLKSNEVAQLFLNADFAITACGGTIHELALCNLPFVGLIVVDNQIPFSQGISKLWNLPVFNLNNIPESNIIAAIQKVSELKKLNWNFHPTLDTHGANRVLLSILNELKH